MEYKFLRTNFLILTFACLAFTSCRQAGQVTQIPEKLADDQQRLPENATKGLQIEEGLYATLFASEPMMTNPTNMDIDARGRVWICEGYNYRVKLNPGHQENSLGDRILILEDTDGDGVADTSKVFYQGPEVNSALGIAVLGNKVIVSVSPKVYVFTDLDGDDVADKMDVLFEGIGGEQHDHGIHSFTFGPDGKLYFNFGNEGNGLLDKNGIVVKDIEGVPVNNKGKPYRQGMIIRCNPDGSEVEVLGHNFRNNYELAVDAFGNVWQSDNDDDGNRGVRINYVMEYGNYGYTDEMTGASWQTSRINMEDSIPLRHWHLNDPGVVPNLLQTGAGSPTGMVIYEGNLLPPAFHNQMIHADALPNVVRSYPVRKKGAGYTAKVINIVEGKYDKWFRPSDVTVAPDGSLFIADWYDPGVGGHQVGDLDRGRIFRIAPPNSEYIITPQTFDRPEDATKALESPNIATRYLAWEKLISFGSQAVPELEKLYTSANPRFKARALWMLSKVPNQGVDYIHQALKDKNEDIRITAIRAARQINTDMIPILNQVVNDPSAQVRRAALIALRHNPSPQAPELWAQLANQYDGQDRWYLEALGISADQQWDTFFATWFQKINGKWNTDKGRDIVWRARTEKALPLLQKIIEDNSRAPEDNLKFFRALDFYPVAAKQMVLQSLLQGQHPKQSFINALVLMQLDLRLVPQKTIPKKLIDESVRRVKGRPEFISLVQKYQIKEFNPELMEIVLESRSDEICGNALRALLSNGGKDLVEEKLDGDTAVARKVIALLGPSENKDNLMLLEGLLLRDHYDSRLRVLATRALGRSWGGEDRLLVLMEEGRLPVALDSAVRQILLGAYRPEVKEKARHYFNIMTDEKSILLPIEQLTQQVGNPEKGLAIFSNYCNNCHVVNGKGADFGPNLSEIGAKLAKDALYKAIISPDAGISFGFEGYLIKLKDGKELLGYIASETAETVTVKVVGGDLHNVQVQNIASRRAYEHSLMPTGLDRSMSQEQLVDLVEYLVELK